MSYKLSELATWKTVQISAMNVAITGTPPTMSWSTSAIDIAKTIATSAINSITCNRIVSSEIIKESLLAANTYITMKYINILEDSAKEATFTIPYMIPSGTVSPSADDFRNMFLYDISLITSTIDMTCFTVDNVQFTITPNSKFYSIAEAISGVPSSEYTLWQNLPNNIKVQDKVLYITLRQPKFKYYPLYDPPPNVSTKLLDDMHLKEALKSSSLSGDFIDIFPEITQ